MAKPTGSKEAGKILIFQAGFLAVTRNIHHPDIPQPIHMLEMLMVRYCHPFLANEAGP
jgi:hypothetical protein